MSCNGCRVLRKGCSETCILRPSLQWIESPEAQGYATVFVAKFFGRAGLMSFLSAVPQAQRPAIFQSLLFEAAGRTVNPVNGAVGLLWTGNWHLCQAAVETVLRGGALHPTAEFRSSGGCSDMFKLRDPILHSRSRVEKRRRPCESLKLLKSADLDLSLTQGFQAKVSSEKRRPVTPSRNSEESGTTTCSGRGFGSHYNDGAGEAQLLNLF